MLLGPVMMVSSGCSASDEGGSLPAVVVTTSILGDVVTNVVNGGAEVQVIMPIGADPHDFEPSARQVAAIVLRALIAKLDLTTSISERKVAYIHPAEAMNAAAANALLNVLDRCRAAISTIASSNRSA